ncbi:MAG TPA: hypothetical protein VFF87_01480 [Hyphomicrobium sp.]|nr:hypothetical protein [Hyphomicrobium sp.]
MARRSPVIGSFAVARNDADQALPGSSLNLQYRHRTRGAMQHNAWKTEVRTLRMPMGAVTVEAGDQPLITPMRVAAPSGVR